MNAGRLVCKWRGQDLNLRPRGYEPRELPGCSTPRQFAPGFSPTTYNCCKSVSFPDNHATDGQAGVDPGTLDVSSAEGNEKEPLSITDNGSGKSGRLDLN